MKANTTHTAVGEATLNPQLGAKSIFELAVMSQKEIGKKLREIATKKFGLGCCQF